MAKKVLVINGSPKRDGNTAMLVRWFADGAAQNGAAVVPVRAADLRLKANGCLSCRACQTREAYGCAIDDDVRPVLLQMAAADVIVLATPLYFFAMSAQLKIIVDRMFSLYKWDNAANTMTTALTGKTLVLIASAYEDVGLQELARPFLLTADYTGMQFETLLVPDAGVSGEVARIAGIREQAIALGRKVTAEQ